MPVFSTDQREWLHERRRAAARGGESLEDIVGKIQVFGKTQGRVVSSYTTRLRSASKNEKMADDKRQKVGKLQGVMDQLDAAVGELESAARAI